MNHLEGTLIKRWITKIVNYRDERLTKNVMENVNC